MRLEKCSILRGEGTKVRNDLVKRNEVMESLANEFGEEILSDFCPFCGADMREEDHETD